MEQAIEFEAARQIEILEGGGKIEQETRLYDPERNETRSMRTKEDAQDYRYFPDPDLLPLAVTDDQIETIRATLPELPSQKRERFLALGLNDYQASLLTSDREIARVSSEIFQKAPRSEITRLANWLTGPIAALQNEQGGAITYGKIDI